jgi:hypothetical protein
MLQAGCSAAVTDITEFAVSSSAREGWRSAGGIAGRSLASTMPARNKSARCSPPPSQSASRLRPRSRRRRNHIGAHIIIDNIRGEPLANDVSGEQTLNIGKAGQIAQKVAPSPGSVVSSVTSAHDVTR